MKKHEIISSAVKPELKVALDLLAEKKGITRSTLVNMLLTYALDQYEAAESGRFEEVIA